MPVVDSLSVAFSALADPTRRDILTRLGSKPVTVGELAANYAMSRPAISQHLAVLEDAGLIVRERRAQWRECRVRESGLDDVSGWIAQQRAEWSERFGYLEQRLLEKRQLDRNTPPIGKDDRK